MFRIVVAGVTVLCGVGLAVWQLFQSHWISSIGYLVAGVLLGALIALGILESYEHPVFVVGFGLVGILGLFAVFAEHSAFESGRAEMLAEGVTVFAELDPLRCELPPTRIAYLQEAGVRACAMQGINDQIDATLALQRAQVVPPEATVVDGLFQLTENERPDPCINLLHHVARACPNSVSKGLREKLDTLRRK